MSEGPKNVKPLTGAEHVTLEPLTSSKISNAPRGASPGQRVRIFMKVRTPDYVPPDVKVRKKIDSHLFTAESDVGDLQKLQADPQVESIAISEVLGTVGTQSK
jgi:hypothetical protein